MEKLFALWKYNGYDYETLLGGTVDKIREDGYISTKEYGPGNYFKPVKILPLETGKKLLEDFKKILSERDQQYLKLKKEYSSNYDLLMEKHIT